MMIYRLLSSKPLTNGGRFCVNSIIFSAKQTLLEETDPRVGVERVLMLKVKHRYWNKQFGDYADDSKMLEITVECNTTISVVKVKDMSAY